MEILLVAITLGLTAGLNPGPLGVFVIHQTLIKGPREGFFASLAPWLTDGPIILLSLFISLSLKNISWFLGIVSLAGAAYLAYLAFKIMTTPQQGSPAQTKSEMTSMFTAVKINFLNPNPYIFWLTIGGSYISRGTKLDGVLFIVCTLSTLSLPKFGVALFLRLLGSRFNSAVYTWILRSLSLPLFVFSGQLFLRGYQILSTG